MLRLQIQPGHLLLTLTLSCVWACGSADFSALHAAELVTLSPENYEEYRPQGKEVDAVWGDYVLRNDKITLAVADDQQHNGRSGGRRGNWIQGRIIDLTLREDGNDLLGYYDPAMYWPNHRGAPKPARIINDRNKQGDFNLAAEAHKQPGREPQSAEEVVLKIPCGGDMTEARYRLADGWPYVQCEMEFHNPTDKPREIPLYGMMTLGPESIVDNPHVESGVGQQGNLFWFADPLFGQAYGILVEDETLSPFYVRVRSAWLMHHCIFGERKPTGFTLQPDETKVVIRKLLIGANVFDVQATAADLRGQELRELTLEVSDKEGGVPEALVTAYQGKTVYGIARTNAEGRLKLRLPKQQFRLLVKPRDREEQERTVSADADTLEPFEFAPSAWVDVRVTDDSESPLPCKIQFRGVAPTKDPLFFTTMGDERVEHMLQPATGEIKERIPPGKYRVIITRGPEYDAYETEMEAKSGQTTEIRATLKRSVDTSGWISAEFANRSTQTLRWSISTTRGRVLNLLAEGIEFAPATETHHIFSYKPILAELSAERWLRTEDGINLAQPVRKSFTAQNAFPLKYVPGDQDGGMPQRPAHVLQVYWLSNVPHKIDERGEIITTGGDRKLIQVTPPGIWRNDGRLEGMSWLLDERKTRLERYMRDARLRELAWYHAMEIQPLDVFLDLPVYDSADPQGERDLQAWHDQLTEREAEHWPEVEDRNRDWLRMLNLGYRITGVVNNAARTNLHGTGHWRNYLQVGKDDPAALETGEILDAIQSGAATMTNGPFLEVTATAGDENAGPGDDLLAEGKTADLSVKVQCPDWIDIDQVQVLFNGHRVESLTFKRADGAAGFVKESGPVRYEAKLPLKLDADTRVIVLAAGQGKNLRPLSSEEDKTFTAIAMSNPIYIDTDGNGFKPHSPVDDKVFTRLDASATPQAGKSLPLILTMRNTGKESYTDEVTLEVSPADAAEIVSPQISLSLQPGAQKSFSFTVMPTGKQEKFVIRIQRSTVDVGRRPAGIDLILGKQPKQLDAGWLYEDAPDLIPAGLKEPVRHEPKKDEAQKDEAQK